VNHRDAVWVICVREARKWRPICVEGSREAALYARRIFSAGGAVVSMRKGVRREPWAQLDRGAI